jgi:hypothetical protein
MDIGKQVDAENLLLDPRISVDHCPHIWQSYIDRQCKAGNHLGALKMIDKLKAKCISDIFKSLYNKVIEKFVVYRGRTQVNQLREIIDYLLERKVELTYTNQMEVLAQLYHQKDKDVFIAYILELDYTLDPNVFNLMLSLILDQLDFETASKMFSLVFDNRLKKVDMMNVDVSKSSLKCLLKIQMNKAKSGEGGLWDLLESEKSEMASVLGSPRSRL